MKSLQEALCTISEASGSRSSVQKHLAAVGINGWEDITKQSLYDFKDHLLGAVSTSTAATIMARTCAMLTRFSDEVELPKDYRRILSVKRDKPMRTYLSPGELELFELVDTYTDSEAVVKYECLLEAFTGARVSDIVELTKENITGNTLTYVSKKTKVRATVPVSDKIKGWIKFVQENRAASPKYKATRGNIITRLCERAEIDTPVAVFEGGKNKKGAKYLYVTSHTFRISFVTNLQQAGLDLLTISRMAGHTNTAMTERYCAFIAPKVTKGAAEYLGI